MAVTRIEKCIAKGQLVPLYFVQAGVAASQTDTDMPIMELADPSSGVATALCTSYEAPFDYQIVAIGATLSTAGTVGTLTVVPTIAGTAQSAPSLAITTAAADIKKAARNTVRGSAGDAIGVHLTTGGTWNGTSSDIVVVVWVIFEVDGI